MSEEHNVSMPAHPGATVIVTGINDGPAPAPTGPDFVSPTEGMTASQAAAMRFVDANRAALARDPNNVALVKQNRAALDHALRGGPSPDWLSGYGSAEESTPDTPAQALERQSPDSGDHGFNEAMNSAMAPMEPQELAHYRTDCVTQGIHPSVAETMAHLAGEFGIPRAVASDLKAVAVQHFGGADAFDSIPVLDDAQQGEMQAAAIAKYGEAAIRDLTQQARQVLADKGLLEHFDNLGLTKSSMAFDRRALRALIFWGKASAAR